MNTIFFGAVLSVLLASLVQYILTIILKIPDKKYLPLLFSTVVSIAATWVTYYIGSSFISGPNMFGAFFLFFVCVILFCVLYYYLLQIFFKITFHQSFILIFNSGIIALFGMWLYSFIFVPNLVL